MEEEVKMLMQGIRNATNIFQMVEAVRQCDVYVQNTNKPIRDALAVTYKQLLPWQQLLITQYGLNERYCFTFQKD